MELVLMVGNILYACLTMGLFLAEKAWKKVSSMIAYGSMIVLFILNAVFILY